MLVTQNGHSQVFGYLGIHSPQPTAHSQQPTANSQQPTANSQRMSHAGPWITRPGLIQKQFDEVNGRSKAMFEQEISEAPPNAAFDELEVGQVYAVTLRYWNGLCVTLPGEMDRLMILNHGYPQPQVAVVAAKVVRKVSLHQVEVELDGLVCLSHRSGPTVPSDFFVLHKDGSVRYWNPAGGDEVEEWGRQYRPTWEFTTFPVLPSLVHGVPLP